MPFGGGLKETSRTAFSVVTVVGSEVTCQIMLVVKASPTKRCSANSSLTNVERPSLSRPVTMRRERAFRWSVLSSLAERLFVGAMASSHADVQKCHITGFYVNKKSSD